jgi:hypothetical protein
MNDQLKNALDKMQASGRKTNVFFRDDDVDQDEESLRLLYELFMLEQVPLNLEVIPGLLTDSAIEFLQRYNSPLFELNQHGWRHTNGRVKNSNSAAAAVLRSSSKISLKDRSE